MRGGGEGVGEEVGIMGGFTRAEVKGFEAAVCEEAVERRGHCANGVLKE